jgi:predicted tellurium resistance membrane protein TerC
VIYDIVGIIGVSLVVFAYFLIQTEKVTVKEAKYSLLNMIGSSLIIVSLFVNFNLPSLIIESFWVLISLIGIIRYYRKSMNSKKKIDQAQQGKCT